MTNKVNPENQEIIRRILALTEAKKMVVMLILAERARLELIPGFHKTAKIFEVHIILCWDWFAHKSKDLEQVDEDFHTGGEQYELYNEYSEIEKNDDTMQAYSLCLSSIGYVTYLSFELTGESPSSDAVQSSEDLELTLENIPLKKYLTTEILVFLGLDQPVPSAKKRRFPALWDKGKA